MDVSEYLPLFLQIIVIENPHPMALPVIEDTIENKFQGATVIFIGSNDYRLCNRSLNLDK